ncbi:MAG: VF530 family protein [Pseudomonadota bacterium]
MHPPIAPLSDVSDIQPEPLAVARPKQHNNPLHGLTLETIVTSLVTHFGWAELARRIPVRCFNNDPSIGSSLKFLRKTPWARDKVEGLYIAVLQDIHRVK